MFPVTLAARFRSGERSLTIAIYFAQWGADHGRRQNRHRIALPRFWNVGIADSDFIRSSRRKLIDAQALAPLFSKNPSASSEVKNRAGLKIWRQLCGSA